MLASRSGAGCIQPSAPNETDHGENRRLARPPPGPRTRAYVRPPAREIELTGIDSAGTAYDAAISETVVRIANSVAGVTDSIVSPAGDRLGVKVGATVNWLLPDLHGDIADSLSGDEATVANAIRYDPYGETLATGSAGGTAVGEDAWKYQGRLDIAPDGLPTPLYDMSARFYAPGIGAFTQLDTYAGTAQNPLSMNRFLYAAANPATLTDPTGHCAALLAWAGGPETGIPATAFCGLLLLAGSVEFALGGGPGLQQRTIWRIRLLDAEPLRPQRHPPIGSPIVGSDGFAAPAGVGGHDATRQR